MKRIFTAVYAKPLSSCLVATLIALCAVPGPVEAMHLPAAPQTRTEATPIADRTADLARIQKVLESKAIQQRLMDYGLSSEEAAAKINGLSNEQIHLVSSKIDALQAGGMRSNDLIIVLLIVLLIVIIV